MFEIEVKEIVPDNVQILTLANDLKGETSFFSESKQTIFY